MADEVLRAGQATIKVQNGRLIAQLDKMLDGAASSFEAIALDIIREVQADAAVVWPQSTGLSARSMTTETRVKDNTITVVALNSAKARGIEYAYYVKFSKLSAESVRAMETRWRTGNLTKSEENRAEATKHAYFKKYGRYPTAEQQRAYFADRVKFEHGEGAPPSLTGRGAWSYLIKRRVKQREPELVQRAQRDLDRLAGLT